jgi:hypothetical protein
MTTPLPLLNAIHPTTGHNSVQSTRRAALAWVGSLAVNTTLALTGLQAGAADAPAALPATTAADDVRYAAAMAQFNRALAGDEAAIAPAAAQFRALMAADPAQPVYRAQAGSATCLLASTTILPWKKMAFAEDGLALLDKALAQLTPAHDAQRVGGVPASLMVRFSAASTFGALPGMFNRGERGAKLLDEVLKSPLLAEAPLPFRASVWLRAADSAASAQRADEARQWLQRVASSGAPQAGQAQARLKAL